MITLSDKDIARLKKMASTLGIDTNPAHNHTIDNSVVVQLSPHIIRESDTWFVELMERLFTANSSEKTRCQHCGNILEIIATPRENKTCC